MSTSIKNRAIAREHQRAHERKANRSGYTSRNYWLYILFVWVVLPAGTLLSVFTEGFNYYHTWAASFADSWRWFPVLSLALIVNALVIMLGKGCVDDVQDAVLSGKTFDKATFALKLIIFVGAFYWSVSNSMEGAPLLRTHFKETRQPVAELLLDPDTINADYADRRQQQLDIIAAAKKTTWKGNITRDAMRAMRAAQAELAKIDAAIAAERSEVASSNDATTLAYQQELEESASKATTIAGVGQLIMLLSVVFIGLWYTGVEDDLADKGHEGAAAGARKGTESREARSIGFRPAASAAAPPYYDAGGHDGLPESRRRIGFKMVGHADHSLSHPDASPVETRLDSVETVSPESVEAQSHLAAWRSHNGNLKSYQNRPDTEVNRKGIDRYQAMMDHEEKQLARLGLRIEFRESPRREYVLVPL